MNTPLNETPFAVIQLFVTICSPCFLTLIFSKTCAKQIGYVFNGLRGSVYTTGY